MAQWFDFNDGSSTTGDLPWMKEYVPHPAYDLEGYEVLEAYPSTRGLLLITTKFKAFVFKREKLYEFLIEAFEVWVGDNTIPSCLVVEHNSSGKVRLGVDENELNVAWNRTEKGFVRSLKSEGGEKTEYKPNPLLPPSHARTHAQASQSQSNTSSTSDFQNPPARRGRKGASPSDG